MTEIVRAGSRDRAPGTQIGVACELRRKPGAAVPELPMDGGPRIRAGLGDPGFSGLHHPAFCNPLPATRDGPLTDGAAACEYPMRFVRVPELTAEPARQQDEPPENPMVRYRSSSCQATITFDADRFVTPCQDHRERAGRGSSSGPVSTAERPGSSTGAAHAARCCAGPVSPSSSRGVTGGCRRRGAPTAAREVTQVPAADLDCAAGLPGPMQQPGPVTRTAASITPSGGAQAAGHGSKITAP